MDIDIDSANRDKILELIKNVPAIIQRGETAVKHNTGVYVTDIPNDPATGWCTLDHKEAEDLGYVKLDLLNVSVYEDVRDEEHLNMLMTTPPKWEKLQEREFVEQIIHINKHFDTMQKLAEPVTSIPRMAMFLALIRPAKRHLIGKTWKEMAGEIWTIPSDGSYYFKKAHAVSYSFLVTIHMNLLSGM